ncbi:zf-HC2 domain-containing protein [Aeromicrobium sp.]|uniref:zf-HC2 domain-containing protein n=1 Tax=Aeromicrobium sp. TaxID=1871063 RepID=UPI0030BA2C87
MTAEHPHALLGAYALDALGRADRAQFTAHLEACTLCQAELAEFRETARRFGEVERPSD